MVRVIAAVVVVLVALVAVAGPVGAQEDVTITVSVVDNAGGAVSHADLTVSWNGGSAEATTKSNGKALVDVPKGSDLNISVSHPQYVRNDPYEVTNATGEEVTVEVAPRGSLAVHASEAAGAASDARVIVRKGGHIVADGVTDGSGTYRTGAIEQGEYSVAVRKPGYYRNLSTVTVDGSVSHDVRIRQGSVSLHFEVTDPHFSPPHPVGGVTLALGGVGEFKTLASGEQDIRVPVNTDLSLSASKDGYDTVTRSVSVGEKDDRVNVSISRTKAVNLTAVNNRVVAGERVAVTAVDEYGDPIEGAAVLIDGDRTATTDASGHAAVRVSDVGEHELRARFNGTDSSSVTVRALQGETATPTPTATATPSPTAAATPTPTETAGQSGVSTFGLTLLTGFVGIAVAIAVLVVLSRR
ncbi:MAG: hypothetical protein ABEJ28_08685 [Salinigranum sp.]